MPSSIILYDGVCKFCNFWVKFILKHDKKAMFHFAALQSNQAKKILNNVEIKTQVLQSVILVEDGIVMTESDAVLHICKSLSGFWRAAYAAIIIPKFIRNAVYHFVAKRRYAWFGKYDTCLLPKPEYAARFLLD